MSDKLIALKILEIDIIGGGTDKNKKFCDCAISDNADLKLSKKLISETGCEDWCCNLIHKEFGDRCGAFYIWDIEHDEANAKWKKC